MKKIMSIVFVVFLFLGACSNEKVIIQKIINDSLELVEKSEDFDRKEVREYKVGDALINPFFRNHDKDIYSLYFTAMSKNQKIKSTKIIAYELIIGEGENKVSLAKQLDARISFEPHFDDADWGPGVMFAGMELFDKTKLSVDDNSKIKLILEVEVESSRGTEKKIIEYDMRYEEEKHLAIFMK
jgi:hypothetical protein